MKTIPLGSRSYGAHAPRGLASNPSLVVALHAGTQTPAQHERLTGWSKIATRTKSCVVVYPAGLKRSWNAGNSALGYAGRTTVDDVGFLDAVILDACARWGVTRVLVSGFSNGAMLAHYHAANGLAHVAAIAGVSGGFSRLPSVGVTQAVAGARIVHGVADDHVPFAGGVGPRALDGYNHLPIELTASWWRGQGADVVTDFHPGGHEWPSGEAEKQWEWFRGLA